jgi:O-antigen/teichoic acid export membrane protein
VLSSIVFPIFFFLLFYRYQLFVSVFSEKYIPAIPVFFISIMVLPLKAYNFTTVLQNRHKGSVITMGAILDLLLACLLMYPLYIWLGLPGVALSFVITTYLQAAFYLYHAAKVLGVPIFSLLPFANWLKKLIVFAIVLIAIHYLTALYFTGLIALILGCGATGVVVLISLTMEMKNIKKGYVSP